MKSDVWVSGSMQKVRKNKCKRARQKHENKASECEALRCGASITQFQNPAFMSIHVIEFIVPGFNSRKRRPLERYVSKLVSGMSGLVSQVETKP